MYQNLKIKAQRTFTIAVFAEIALCANKLCLPIYGKHCPATFGLESGLVKQNYYFSLSVKRQVKLNFAIVR